jgi:hypothetical protein
VKHCIKIKENATVNINFTNSPYDYFLQVQNILNRSNSKITNSHKSTVSITRGKRGFYIPPIVTGTYTILFTSKRRLYGAYLFTDL